MATQGSISAILKGVGKTTDEFVYAKVVIMKKIIGLIGSFSLLGHGVYANTTIELNGRAYSTPWKQNEKGQIFVQDHWVRRNLGATFLSSDRPDRQRYQWYGSPAFAAAVLESTSRLLQIDAFKQDWRTETSGNALKIFTPDTQITEMRRNSTAKGERITLALSRPTPWQQTLSGNQLTVTIDAVGTPPNLDKLTQPTDRIPSLKLQPKGKELTLVLQFNPQLIPQVRTLSNPPRLVIDLEEGYLPPAQKISWQSGITWREEWVSLKDKRFQLYALEINPQVKGIGFKPLWANAGMTGNASLATIATNAKAVAAINGGFFNRDRQLPVGPLKRDGVWYAGAVFKRGAIAWNDRGEFVFDRLDYSETITPGNGEKIKLTNLNSGFVQQGIARYLPSWGEYTNLTDNETIVTIQNNQVMQSTTAGESLTQKFPIPKDGYILVARQVAEISKLLPLQTNVRGEVVVRPQAFNQLPHLLGAGPLLIKDGKPVTDALKEGFSKTFSSQSAPRSVVARLKGGNLLLITIYGSPTLEQTTQILQQLGAIDALNLDGGGSSGLWLGGATLDRQGETRSIHNALGVFIESSSAKADF